MTTQYVIQFKRKPSATWTSSNPILARGEPGFELDTFKMKIGDGSTAWNSLPYQNGLGVSGNLQNLTDVTLTSLATGDVLSYDATSGKWVNDAGIATDIENLLSRVTTLESVIPSGSIQAWSMPYAPTGWLKCNGLAVSRTQYQSLFNALVPALDTVTFSGTSNILYSTPIANRFMGYLSIGDPVFFTTTGSLPTGIVPNTIYYYYGGGANNLNVATTRTNTLNGWTTSNLLTFSGTGTGIHTIYLAPYGIGDGSTTFNLPDFRDKTLVGFGVNDEFDAVNKKGGEKSHILTSSEMPVHSHTGTTNAGEGSHRHWISAAAIDDRNFTGTGNNSQDYGVVSDAGSYSVNDGDSGAGSNTSTAGSTHQHTFTTQDAGGQGGTTQAHNVLQPYAVVNYVIKT